jgi:acyl-CoA synthetase (AMP-forming)/AMP-acid ligase II
MGHSPNSKFISWLPTYHDMGLIGGILQPLYGGFPLWYGTNSTASAQNYIKTMQMKT